MRVRGALRLGIQHRRLEGLQASCCGPSHPDLVIQFQRLTKSTKAARKGAQDLLQLAEDASKPALFHSTSPLTGAVVEAQTDNEKFLQSFSALQKSGLNPATGRSCPD